MYIWSVKLHQWSMHILPDNSVSVFYEIDFLILHKNKNFPVLDRRLSCHAHVIGSYL